MHCRILLILDLCTQLVLSSSTSAALRQGLCDWTSHSLKRRDSFDPDTVHWHYSEYTEATGAAPCRVLVCPPPGHLDWPTIRPSGIGGQHYLQKPGGKRSHTHLNHPQQFLLSQSGGEMARHRHNCAHCGSFTGEWGGRLKKCA